MSTGEAQKLRVALAGNPNVGKSTLFNALTGLRQHTGNWPGKTVGAAVGVCRWEDWTLELTDLPGTYSLTGGSEEERLAALAIETGDYDCIVAVCDGSSLERSLILALQILSGGANVVLCLSLMDEAARAGLEVDREALEALLGVPVVCTAAGDRDGQRELLQTVVKASQNPQNPGKVWENPVLDGEKIAAQCVRAGKASPWKRRRGKVDRVLVSGYLGIPILLLLLLGIVWLTVWGANYPSMLLEKLFDWGYALLRRLFAPAPGWLSGILVDGVYATAARVMAVMVPPMAIFFPLFTLLEDMGYLPRMAFLLDHGMRRCGGCGKQALTLCMGLGCNAVGVTGCRIIDSPRERAMAILTNAMVPCNGRFPTLIVLGSLFFPSLGSGAIVAGCIVLGVAGAMAASWGLSRTTLRGQPSHFLMEMPPFRKPRIGQILVRSVVDRTAKIALRALKVAAPAGAVLWILSETRMLSGAAAALEPVGRFLGMDGVILLAFCLSLPANELLLPVVMLALHAGGSLQEAAGMDLSMLLGAGWTAKTAVCTMVFTLFHWPCATTLATVYHETGCLKKTAAAFFLPTAVGVALCALLNWIL